MLRTIVVAIGVPVATVLLWLAIGTTERRADFVVASDELRTVDPQRVSYMDEIQVANSLFEGLTRLNPVSLLAEPACAESWEISSDRLQYKFQLRNNLQWTNGDPITAEHFRFSWLRALDPATESQYSSLLFAIAGAEAYYRSISEGKPNPVDSVGIRAIDHHTLCVSLRAPCAYFLDLTAFPTFAPLHPPTIERLAYRDGKSLPTRHLWTRPENLVCNGPFVLARWDFKRRLLLEKNERYWDKRNIGVDSIEVMVAISPAAALMAYETGRIDLVRGVEPEVGRSLKNQAERGQRADFHVGPRFATFFLRVNCERAPFAGNANLRRALSLAIDREAICENVLGLGETPAWTYLPPGAIPLMPRNAADGGTIFYQPPVAEIPQERAAYARELLQKSGFDPASRAIRLSYASDPPQQKRIVEAIQAMWERNLGLRVELDVMERKVLAQRIRALDYDIVRSDWYGDYMDPSTFLDMFTTGNGQNRTGWSNADYDAAVRSAMRATDEAFALQQFAIAERILCFEQQPIIPVYFKTGNFLLKSGFGGFGDNIRDTLAIQRVARNN